MHASTRVNPADARQLVTAHLCERCTKRVLEFSPNPRYLAPPVRDERVSPRRRPMPAVFGEPLP